MSAALRKALGERLSNIVPSDRTGIEVQGGPGSACPLVQLRVALRRGSRPKKYLAIRPCSLVI
jgi:hypothetical protein